MEASLAVNLPAAPGKTTCQLVRLDTNQEGAMTAVPVFGRSALISILTKADGYVLAEENQEGFRRGEKVKVYLM